jgi:chaperonin GroEL
MVILSSNFEYEEKLKNAMEKVSNFVLSTYGPYGQNILINKNGKSFLTKDGVTVARAISSKDSIESAIIDIIKQTAESTVKEAGDGTTTSILFLSQLLGEIKDLLKVTSKNDITPSLVKEKFENLFDKLFAELQKNSKEISSKEDLYKIAYMASNGDKLISELVSDLIDQVGVSGSAVIKTSKSGKTYLQFIEGLKFKSMVASTTFLNDLQQKKVLNDCVIVISNVQIEFSEDLLRLLSDCVADKKSVLFVCPSMDEKSLTTIIANVTRGNHLNCAVLYPSYLGQEKLEVFEDIALLCGTVVNTTKNINRTMAKQWGYCKSVEISKTECLLTEANASHELLDKTIASLRADIQASEDDNANKRLDARINRLTSTMGVVYVGGQTDAEIIEKRHRIEDAMESCQSAIKKGIIEGGGTGLYYCIDQVGNLIDESSFLEKTVYGILLRICSSVSLKLYERKQFVQYKDDKIYKILDLRQNKMVDAFEGGIIESVWTLQSALKNAFSTAWVLCQTNAAIIMDNTND